VSMFDVKLNEPSALEFTVVITSLSEKVPTNFTQLNETGTPAALVVVNLLITLPFALIVPQFPVQIGARFLQEFINIENKSKVSNI